MIHSRWSTCSHPHGGVAVYADSILRPNYTVFGWVDPGGMAALDAIAAGGVAPTPENPAPVDGAPALRADIIDADVHAVH